MSDHTKKTIEKNAHGDYEFTPYGEFLSYFHAHLEIFKRFGRSRNIPNSEMNQQIKELKSFMASHVKNVDQYFPNIPKFAEILHVSKDDLSGYLNENFLEVLPIVQDKFKKAEIEKLESSPDREFDRVTEEILEKVGFSFPEGKKFTSKGNLVVLEDTATGEIVEPQGLMAGISAPPPAVIGADPKAKPVQAKVIPDHPILEEIVNLFGEELRGEKLEAQRMGEEEEKEGSSEKETIEATEEDVLEDIEDLDFEEPDEEVPTQEEASSVLDDLGDILDMGEPAEELQEEVSSISEEAENYNLLQYFEIVKTILGFQAQKDANGYKKWLAESSDLVKVSVSIRTNHLKEMKGESVPWESILSQILEKVEFNQETLDYLKEKIIRYNWARIGLDRGLNEFKKGNPELIDLVKKALPHIQKAMNDLPDFDKVTESLKLIIGKIPNPEYRKEMGRVLNLVIRFLKTKIS